MTLASCGQGGGGERRQRRLLSTLVWSKNDKIKLADTTAKQGRIAPPSCRSLIPLRRPGRSKWDVLSARPGRPRGTATEGSICACIAHSLSSDSGIPFVFIFGNNKTLHLSVITYPKLSRDWPFLQLANTSSGAFLSFLKLSFAGQFSSLPAQLMCAPVDSLFWDFIRLAANAELLPKDRSPLM